MLKVLLGRRESRRRMRLVAAAATLAAASWPRVTLADPATLICQIRPDPRNVEKHTWNGKYWEFVMKVDSQARTVTAISGAEFHGTLTATFTETEIKWQQDGDKYTLSRLELGFAHWFRDSDGEWLSYIGPFHKATRQV